MNLSRLRQTKSRRERERDYVPGDYWIHGNAPVIPNMVEICVAYSTVQDLYGHIVDPIFSESIYIELKFIRPGLKKQRISDLYYFRSGN